MDYIAALESISEELYGRGIDSLAWELANIVEYLESK